MSHFFNILITDQPTLIAEASGNRLAYLIQNIGPQNVWLGDNNKIAASDVTAFRLAPGQVFSGEGDANEPIYGVCAAGQTQILQTVGTREHP